MDELNDQRQQRIKKLDQLRQLGVAPYGTRFEIKDRAGQLVRLHGEKTKDTLEQEQISCTIAAGLSDCAASARPPSPCCRTDRTACRST
ncbi:MAG: hypothetical protein MRJ92_05150 [Nitrospira sp.]|nr:hypothetical protein [Nitrospira sp.]